MRGWGLQKEGEESDLLMNVIFRLTFIIFLSWESFAFDDALLMSDDVIRRNIHLSLSLPLSLSLGFITFYFGALSH